MSYTIDFCWGPVQWNDAFQKDLGSQGPTDSIGAEGPNAPWRSWGLLHSQPFGWYIVDIGLNFLRTMYIYYTYIYIYAMICLNSWIVHLTPNKNYLQTRCSTQTVHTIKTHQFLAQLSDVLKMPTFGTNSSNSHPFDQTMVKYVQAYEIPTVRRSRPEEFIRNSNVIGPTWPTVAGRPVGRSQRKRVKCSSQRLRT